ncbi:hypothetical protein HPB49_007255 [Dermacentor silvarum]|uniref:Uncharacterized protein n=1 Tax=Dermacentor silvarum TaxID=543639 RepID=A0ACB8CW29_DERSI|nr:hypothetical protein HPB49_007255 [Dermacentor silvarum]
MSHVLVKWAEENKWDIYPITCITDVAVGYRLFTQENAMDDLRGTTHMCKWKEGEDAAPAELLEIECHKMVKKLKKMMEEGEGRGGHVKPYPKVDIGGGVVVEEAIIHGLRRNCAGAPAKFARGLMRHLFTAEELRGKSLFGRRLHCRRIPGGFNEVEEQPFITVF